jgi:hypothetical protein
VLLRLLDKEFVDRQTQVTLANRSKYRMAAVIWLARLDPTGALPVLERMAKEEMDLRVRDAALKQVEALRTK